jgi:hypothetical protein
MEALGSVGDYGSHADLTKHSERNKLTHLNKDVFMLCIAHNQDALPVLLAFDELKAAERRIRVDERDGAVVVLAGRHAALATV